MFKSNTAMHICLFLFAALFCSSDAFVVNSFSHAVPARNSVDSRKQHDAQSLLYAANEQSSEAIKQNIEVMRLEAKRRLEALHVRMEELKQHQVETQEKTSEQTITVRDKDGSATAELTATSNAAIVDTVRTQNADNNYSLDSMEGDWVESTIASSQSATAAATSPVVAVPPYLNTRIDTDLLTDTRWKVAYNIGREAGTWMPKEWGRSGDRLIFQIVMDFTNEPSFDRDDFFQGVAGAKVLNVVEAWVLPSGVGRNSHGRQAMRVKATGAYKILPGLGPCGTNIVRFYVELEDQVSATPDSDVSCPQGRVYATCGYFPKRSKQNGVASWKERMDDEHHAYVVRYEQLQRQIEADGRLFSLEKIKLMKESYMVRQELEQATMRLQEARQRDPERSQLRMTRDGRVGLTKEGGVCRKVQKGVAMEYHILGRIELACIDKHEAHDDYQELVHQLHP
ncbi:hypothetical protein MPSEU_000138500 [Mayamaea pseudoterrestris]|nr:hypothetical protein MPSEU_000138500 [Mayamaea pseudoterrestris]